MVKSVEQLNNSSQPFIAIKDLYKTYFMSGVLSQNVEKLQKVSDAIATLDVLLSLATVARDENYVKPIMVNEGEALKIVDGRHPVVQKTSKIFFGEFLLYSRF